MYTQKSGKRETDPGDRAHDHLAAAAVRACPPEDVAAAVRVLTAMAAEDHLSPLRAKMATDLHGNPIMDTPEQRLAQRTWSDAHELTGRLGAIAAALSHAADTAP